LIVGVAAIAEPDVEIPDVLLGVSAIRGESQDAVHHACDKATKKSRRMGRVWREIEVKIKLFFEEFSLDTAGREKRDLKVKEFDVHGSFRHIPDEFTEAG
jgi:hypothetical protein